jgi:hypothetical protein
MGKEFSITNNFTELRSETKGKAEWVSQAKFFNFYKSNSEAMLLMGDINAVRPTDGLTNNYQLFGL